jgi:hemoglobin-like flavoprotein
MLDDDMIGGRKMWERDVELFNDSIERCSSTPDFLRRFYTLFIASSKAVATKFEHTDLRKQARLLKTSLYIMMLASGESEQVAHLERLAKRHSRTELDIKPELYDLWLEKLVQAVREFDPKFDTETETAWRRVLQPGIEYMKSRY